MEITVKLLSLKDLPREGMWASAAMKEADACAEYRRIFKAEPVRVYEFVNQQGGRLFMIPLPERREGDHE